jgi:uncharacterized protein YjbI with pentapeptide repeats
MPPLRDILADEGLSSLWHPESKVPSHLAGISWYAHHQAFLIEQKVVRMVHDHWPADGLVGKKAKFPGASFPGINLSEAILWYADFQGANLQGASFRNAFLKGVGFQGANLRNTHFQGGRTEYCKWSDADLREADFSGCQIVSHQDWLGARLEGAKIPKGDVFILASAAGVKLV